VVAVVALIMAAAPAMATEKENHEGNQNGAFNNGGTFISNGNVGFNPSFNTGFNNGGTFISNGNVGVSPLFTTGLGFNTCNCNTGFQDDFNNCWWCNTGLQFNGQDDFNNCWWCNNDRDDHFKHNQDRDDHNWSWKDR
jgi:hypothetical protein